MVLKFKAYFDLIISALARQRELICITVFVIVSFISGETNSLYLSFSSNLTMPKKKRSPDNEPAIKTKIPDFNLDRVIDLLPCYISIQDREFRILFVNQNFKDDFGDATGRLCHTVYKGSRDICPNCPVRKTFQDKHIHITEETVKLFRPTTSASLPGASAS